MTTNKKKIRNFKSISIIGICLILVLGITLINLSCKKTPETCTTCVEHQLKSNSTLVINEKTYQSYSDNNTAVNIPNTTLISKYENENISSLISSIVDEINLPNINTQNPIALSLFYSGEINTSSNNQLKGILFYNKINDKYYANLWVKNQESVFEKVNELSGISTIITKADMYKINVIKNLEAQNILILLDQSKLAVTQYPSVFQTKVEQLYEVCAPNGGGGGGGSKCNNVPECSSTESGYCTFKESQNGPTTTYCNTVCANSSAKGILNNNGYDIAPEQINNLYLIRNGFLLNSEKGMQYIDDYYYASYYLQDNITLPLALKLYNLYALSLFENLSLFDRPEHANDIIITSEIKILLDEISDIAKNISTDDRYNSIIDNIKNDVQKYENKKLYEIKADF